MPSIITEISVDSSTGVINVGDSFNLSAKYAEKVFSGAGSFSTGDFLNNNNAFNATNTIRKQKRAHDIKSR